MDTFRAPLKNLKEFEDLQQALTRGKGIFQVSGCIDSQKPHLIDSCGDEFRCKLVVTFSEQRAKELYEDCRFFQKDAVYYPARDILFYQSDLRGNLLTRQRISAIKSVLTLEHPMVITTYDALMDRLAPLSVIQDSVCHFRVGDSLQIETLSRQLVQMGYERNYQVEASGQFAIRGGIVDIFPLTEDNPLRIELWDDEIDSLRSFETDSQRSIEDLDEIWIYPASEIVLNQDLIDKGLGRVHRESRALYEKLRAESKTEEAYRVKEAAAQLTEELTELRHSKKVDSYLTYFFEQMSSLLAYFPPEETMIFLDEPARCLERGRVTRQEFAESMQHRLEKGYILPGQMEALSTERQVAASLERSRCVAMLTLDAKVSDLEIKSRFYISARTVNPYNSSFELLVKDLKQYKRNGDRKSTRLNSSHA